MVVREGKREGLLCVPLGPAPVERRRQQQDWPEVREMVESDNLDHRELCD